jgi:hypothetical protein
MFITKEMLGFFEQIESAYTPSDIGDPSDLKYRKWMSEMCSGFNGKDLSLKVAVNKGDLMYVGLIRPGTH